MRLVWSIDSFQFKWKWVWNIFYNVKKVGSKIFKRIEKMLIFLKIFAVRSHFCPFFPSIQLGVWLNYDDSIQCLRFLHIKGLMRCVCHLTSLVIYFYGIALWFLAPFSKLNKCELFSRSENSSIAIVKVLKRMSE